MHKIPNACWIRFTTRNVMAVDGLCELKYKENVLEKIPLHFAILCFSTDCRNYEHCITKEGEIAICLIPINFSILDFLGKQIDEYMERGVPLPQYDESAWSVSVLNLTNADELKIYMRFCLVQDNTLSIVIEEL